MRIRNIKSTAGSPCKCGSWLEHWNNHSGQIFYVCPVIDCKDKPEVGAHVRKDIDSNHKAYIIPLCKRHSVSDEVLEVREGLIFVDADVSVTCESAIKA